MTEALDQFLQATGFRLEGETAAALREQGSPISPALEQFQLATGLELTPAPSPPPEPTILGEFGRGVATGTERIITSDIPAAGGVLLGLIGKEDQAFDLIQLANANAEEIERRTPRPVPSVDHIESVGDFALWSARMLGEQVPVITSIILTGGVGGIAGRLVAKGLISKGVAKQAVQKFGAAGFGAGAVAGASTIETGATGKELTAATGHLQPGLSLGAGLVKGSLEAIVPAAIASRLGIGAAPISSIVNRVNQFLFSKGAGGRIVRGAAAGGAVEMTTEILQESVDIAARDYVDENFDRMGPEAAARLREAAASGLLAGLFFGGIAGGAGPRISPADQRPPSPTEIARGARDPEIQEPPAPPSPITEGETTPEPEPDEAPRLPSPVPLLPPPTKPKPRWTPGVLPGTPPINVLPPGTTPIPLPAPIDTEPGGVHVTGTTEPTVELERVSPYNPLYRSTGVKDVTVGTAIGQTKFIERDNVDLYEFEPVSQILDKRTEVVALDLRDPNVRRNVTAISTHVIEDHTGWHSFNFEDIKAFERIGVFPEGMDSLEKQEMLAELRTARSLAKQRGEGNERARQIYRNLVADGLRIKPFVPDKFLFVAPEGTPVAELPFVEDTPLVPTFRRENSIEDYSTFEMMSQIQGVEDRTGFSEKFKKTEFTRKFKEYNPAKHKPGTVKVIGNIPTNEAQRKSFKKASRLLSRLVKEFLPNEKVFLNHGLLPSLDPESRNIGAGPNLFGQMQPFSENFARISLNMEALSKFKDDTKVVGTLTHEFGHLLAVRELKNAEPGVLEKIYTDYNEARIKSGLGTVEDFMRFFRAPTSWLNYSFGIQSGAEGFFRGTAAGSSFGQRDHYWFSFDEWFAEQTARWFETEAKPMSLVEKFFRGFANKLKRLFKAAFGEKILLEEIKPSEAVRDYLNSLLARRDMGQAPISLIGMQLGMRESRENNAQLMNEEVSEAAPAQGATVGMKRIINSALDGEHTKAKKELFATADKMAWYVKLGWNLIQLADQNKHIPGLQRFLEILREWQASRMQFIVRADTRLKQWRALGKEQADALGRMLFAIDAMEAWPTEQELAEIAERFGLSAEAFNVYVGIREDFFAALDKMQEVLEKDANRTFSDPIQLGLEIGRIAQDMNALRERPYFPHMRFGDFVLVVKDAAGNTILSEQFEKRKEALAMAKRAEKEFPKGYQIRMTKMPKEIEPFRGIPRPLLNKIKTDLNLSPQQREWLETLIVESGPAQSFRTRFLRREGTPGFSLNAMRAYASYFFHGANYWARVEFRPPLQEQIANVEESARTAGRFDKRIEIADFMRRQLDHALDPKPDWYALRSAAFSWWIGGVVVSPFVNLTQVPFVAWPYLSNRFSTIAAERELRKAVLDLHKIYTLKETKIPPDEFRMLNLAIEQGWLEESQATELAGVAEGGTITRMLPGNKLTREIMNIGRYAAWMFQTSEKINRRVVARAAYRLAKQNPEAEYLRELRGANQLLMDELKLSGWGPREATAFLAARDAVERTQFEYAKWAQPEFMRGRKGVLFTFFMFVQNMVWFTRYSPGNIRYLAIMLAMAGMMGLPGAEDLKGVTKLLARLAGKKFDPEREVRELVLDWFGEDPAVPPDLILHGISRVGFGLPHAADAMGIPLPTLDLSPNISMGRIIPGLSEAGALTDLEFEKAFSNMGTEIAGASFGIGINLMKAMADDHPDFYKRWERAMPRAIRNGVRAFRFLEEERERTRSGATVVEFDPNDPEQLAEIVAQGMGFTPTRLSRKWDQQRMRAEALQYWQVRRSMLLAQYDHARAMRDKEGTVDARKSIARFNREVPDGRMKIGRDVLSRSVKERTRRRKLAERGLPGQKAGRQIARDVNRLFPEVVDIEDVR